MSVEIFISDNFRREAKKYLKKFRSLREELVSFQESLRINPKQGDRITESVFKVRLSSKSKGKGKSGGFRIITYLVEAIEAENNDLQIIVTLLSIYDKSEISTLSDSEIKALIDDLETVQNEESDDI
jgi:mRNA-degrading endonuclease RelE of RelBE toxin-antitoxin system